MDDKQKKQFEKDYREGTSVEKMRKKYKMKNVRQIYNFAQELGLKRSSQEGWPTFFSSSKTVKEAVEYFGLSKTKIKQRFRRPVKGFKLYKHNSLTGEELYVYLPLAKNDVAHKDKIWTYVMEKTGKPGVAINLPDDIGWRKATKNKNKKEKIRIVPISDVWLGHQLHDANNLDERLHWIARESHVFAILNGDILYPNSLGSKKIRGKNFPNIVENELLLKFKPIAHKILWAQSGCFEEHYAKMDDLFDPMEYLCYEWDIPYFKSPCCNVVSWKGHMFYFYCIHGKSVAQKRGSKLNAAIRPLEFNEFTHFFVMSHIKDNITKKIRRVIKRKDNLDLKKQYVAICPSFVRYDGSRESKWGYVPPSRGQLNFVLYADGDYHLYSSPQQEFEEIITG